MKTLKQFTLLSIILNTLLMSSSPAQPPHRGRLAQDLPPPEEILVKQALTVKFDHQKFTDISRLLSATLTSGLHQQSVRDIPVQLNRHLHAMARGITANLRAHDVMVRPSSQGLSVDLKIDDLELDIAELDVHSRLSSQPTVSCYNTHLSFGRSAPLVVHTDIGVALNQQGELQLTPQTFDFVLTKAQYAASGPAQCQGPFGNHDELTELAVKKGLRHALNLVAKILRQEAQDFIPVLAETLNQHLKAPLTYDLASSSFLPATRLVFKAQPQTLHTDDQGLTIKLDVAVSSAPSTEQPSPTASAPQQSSTPYEVAAAHLRPTFINATLTSALAAGSREQEITVDLHAQVGNFLKVSELAYFWPDLEQAGSEAEHLRLFASIKQAPSLHMGVAPGELSLKVPAISLRYQIKRNGAWTDYFTMLIQANATLKPELTEGILSVAITNVQLDVGGDWAPTYEPKDRTFDVETASDIFQTVVGVGLGMVSPLQIALPLLGTPEGGIRVDRLRVGSSKLHLGLQAFLALESGH